MLPKMQVHIFLCVTWHGEQRESFKVNGKYPGKQSPLT